ncbi:MAG TPA: hypothetical protein V6C85_24490, partial [Allocoleopsis sp.]
VGDYCNMPDKLGNGIMVHLFDLHAICALLLCTMLTQTLFSRELSHLRATIQEAGVLFYCLAWLLKERVSTQGKSTNRNMQKFKTVSADQL